MCVPTAPTVVNVNGSPTTEQSPRILVGDDDRAIRESLGRLLEMQGYESETVPNGAEVLESLRTSPADLLVLDLMMPGVDGLSVCRVLRSEGERIPILMLTARTETSDRVAGLDAGADDYLPKPFDPEELLARVRALLRRTSAGEPNESDALVVADLAAPLARLAPETWQVVKGGSGADVGPLVREGVPGVGHRVDTSSYFDFHHCRADTYEKIDPDTLARNLAAVAGLVFAVADHPASLGSHSH